MSWLSRSPAETETLARALAAVLEPGGGVVGLCGPLGAGKSLFARAVADGLGLAPALFASPTFTLASEAPLPTRAPALHFVHADFYRVRARAELEDAGLSDWLAPGTLLLVEWADRFPDALPRERLTLHFARADVNAPDTRRLTASATGAFALLSLARWRAQCP